MDARSQRQSKEKHFRHATSKYDHRPHSRQPNELAFAYATSESTDQGHSTSIRQQLDDSNMASATTYSDFRSPNYDLYYDPRSFVAADHSVPQSFVQPQELSRRRRGAFDSFSAPFVQPQDFARLQEPPSRRRRAGGANAAAIVDPNNSTSPQGPPDPRSAVIDLHEASPRRDFGFENDYSRHHDRRPGRF
jgi:hypothetical protein